jgi:hypothetical protein
MRARILLFAVIAVTLAAALAGCDLLRAIQPRNAVLVRVDASGGECPQGACVNRWEILRDGSVVATGEPVPAVEPEVLARIVARIDAADWTTILARPFTGECPRNVDGLEYTYTFPAVTGDVVVASCTTQVDPGQEPFESILGALFNTGG